MNRLGNTIIAAFIVTVTTVTPAMALSPVIPVPEPTTLSLLSGGVALVVIGARWLRRK
jgi:hypothetical protein